MAEQEGEGLAGFDWQAGGDDDFFGQVEKKIEPEVPEIPAGETAEQKAEAKRLADEAKAALEDDDFFKEVDAEAAEKTKAAKLEDEDPEAGEPKPKVKPTTVGSDTYYGDMYKDLKETGLFKHVEFEPEEGEEIDAERLMELQEQEYNSEVSARIEDWATNMDEDAKAFIKFKQEGGNTREFFKAFTSNSGVPEGDIAEESYQDKVIRYSLAQEGWESEDIEDRLAFLTENGKKAKFATRYDAKIEKDKTLRVQQVEADNKARIERDRANEVEFKESISSTLDSVKEIEGFKIKPREKVELLNFLTKRDQKMEGDRTITGFQRKLGEVFQDPQKMVLLAKLVNSDFDMKDFKKNVITDKTRKIKSNLEQRRSLRPTQSGGTGGSSLAELF